MRRVLRWVGVGLGVVLGLAILGAAYVYAVSEHEITRRYNFPLTAFHAPTDAAAITRGKRLATLAGCYNSCHGKQMEGALLFNEPGIAHINAPNLTQIVREYSDPELVRLLRHGVKRDGRTTWIMPSPMFAHLSEQDMGDIIAFVRSAPQLPGPMRDVTIEPMGRLGVVLGKFAPLVNQIDHKQAAVATTDRSDTLKYGEYLVKTSCTECHGQDLRGSDFLHAPNLVIAEAYSEPDFFRLMRTGVGLGNRQLGLMSEVGASRFPSFTDQEVLAIRAYLKTRVANSSVLTAGTSRPNGAS
jgi:mono/diheme cytochrome c family protein